ncbi:MAG: mandelate racemase/muconate lactonizing enzyme family protein [Chloroflexi bacterium]|nr:mandelate racemase/muconate lactonizing enzyme family protein [Chloroflexota bacterium]
MPITEVLANTVVLPLGKVLVYPTRTMISREFTLVRVRDSSGAEGTGYCCGGYGYKEPSRVGHLCTLAVRDLLRDYVLGEEPSQVEGIWDAMFKGSVLHGRRGMVLRSMSAIDIALWDLRARQAGVSLATLLGTHKRDTVPAYGSGGVYVKGKTPDDLAKEVKSYVDMGFKAVKIKVGTAAPREDVARVKACREAIGPDVQLLLDANNAWPDAAAAIRVIRLFEEYDPGWIEEPVMPDDIKASAAIAAAIRPPVATGEIEATRWGFENIIEHRAASILQPDVGVCGGITEWRKIAALAAGHSLRVSPHWFPEIHVHLVAATPNAMWVEYVPETHVSSFRLILKSSLEVRQGELVVPRAPGLGIELDDKAIARYSVDGWQ